MHFSAERLQYSKINPVLEQKNEPKKWKKKVGFSGVNLQILEAFSNFSEGGGEITISILYFCHGSVRIQKYLTRFGQSSNSLRHGSVREYFWRHGSVSPPIFSDTVRSLIFFLETWFGQSSNTLRHGSVTECVLETRFGQSSNSLWHGSVTECFLEIRFGQSFNILRHGSVSKNHGSVSVFTDTDRTVS